MSTPTALQPEHRALTWTEHDLQQLNIEMIDVPSTEIADQAFHKANLSYEQPPAADTDASCRPWYDDFCWLLVEWFTRENMVTTDGKPAHVAWTTESLELHGPSGTTTVQADFIFSLAGVSSLAYATPRGGSADQMGYYVAILIALAEQVAAEVVDQESYPARLLCPCEELGKFVFLTADVSHAFIENLQNGPPQVETLCVYREVVQEGVHVEKELCDIAEGVHEVAEVDNEEEVYEPTEEVRVEQEVYEEEEVYVDAEEVYEPTEDVRVEQEVYEEEEVYVDAEEEVHLEEEVQDVTDHPAAPAADNAATEVGPS